MTISKIVTALALAVIATPVSARQQGEEAALGYRVKVDLIGMYRGQLQGELLAASADSVWVLEDGQPISAPLENVRRVRVRHHALGPGEAMRWALAGTVITGAALMVACSSVEGTENCWLTFPLVGVPWLLFGGLSAATLGGANTDLDTPISIDDLRRYARYPQGYPPRVVVTVSKPSLGIGVRLPLPPIRFVR